MLGLNKITVYFKCPYCLVTIFFSPDNIFKQECYKQTFHLLAKHLEIRNKIFLILNYWINLHGFVLKVTYTQCEIPSMIRKRFRTNCNSGKKQNRKHNKTKECKELASFNICTFVNISPSMQCAQLFSNPSSLHNQ